MGGPDQSGFQHWQKAPPQFGAPEPGVDYPDRRGAHGIARNEKGEIALARIERADGWIEYDLPGGGVDAGETDQAALVREFLEETGLPVTPGKLVARARQYWRTDKDETRNADFQIFAVNVAGPPGRPTEPDHSLVWMAPERALASVRHEAHAWALRTYLNPRAI